MIIGINAIGITVGSPGHLVPILSQLDAHEIAPTGQDQRAGRPIYWALGNLMLEMDAAPSFDRLPPAPKVYEAGLTHFCLQSLRPESLKAKLEASEVRFASDLVTLGNGTYYAYGTTPAGFVVELESAEYAPSTAPPAWLSHVAFCTHDLERLSAFYAALTGRPAFGGFRVPRNPVNDRITGVPDVDLKVSWVACGNIMLEFWQYLSPKTTPRSVADHKPAGINRIVFEVEDIAGAMPHIVQTGVEITADRVDEEDGRSFVEGLDPDGNALTFVSYERVRDDARALRQRPNFSWMAQLNEIRANLTTSSFRPRQQW
jgi:catechol 2,3-dioxygenase-like lactoylglutathione lyase family enzyme